MQRNKTLDARITAFNNIIESNEIDYKVRGAPPKPEAGGGRFSTEGEKGGTLFKIKSVPRHKIRSALLTAPAISSCP